jgi:hypothetical protein
VVRIRQLGQARGGRRFKRAIQPRLQPVPELLVDPVTKQLKHAALKHGAAGGRPSGVDGRHRVGHLRPLVARRQHLLPESLGDAIELRLHFGADVVAQHGTPLSPLCP